MKTKNFLKTCFCLFLVSLSFSCGNRSGDIVDSLIPDLTATWTNTADATDNYFFLNATPNVASSTFDGNEVINQVVTNTFSGSFQNSKINFTFNSGPKNGTKYTGKINGNSANATMTLTTLTGTITLQKH
jgi:hypothetical protein